MEAMDSVLIQRMREKISHTLRRPLMIVMMKLPMMQRTGLSKETEVGHPLVHIAEVEDPLVHIAEVEDPLVHIAEVEDPLVHIMGVKSPLPCSAKVGNVLCSIFIF
jgi:hypothetical protein